MTDYAAFDATGLAQAIRERRMSPREVFAAALDAIAQKNPGLNAVTELNAGAAAAQIERGLPDGPLHGVPVLLKDLGCPAVGTRSTYGSALMRNVAEWDHDCVYVERLKAAGAVILGRTTSGEFGITLLSEPVAHGPARNPHDLNRTPGGSSGGSAAAVASGMVPLAHATDGCGSIRVPASHCGLVGLKPGRARVSFAPDAGESWGGMSTMGGLTRSVRDAALLLDVVAGPASGDPYAAAAVLATRQPLRIGVSVAARGPVDADCIEAVHATAERLRVLGHTVEDLSLPLDLDEAIPHLIAIWSAQLWTLAEPRYRALGRALDGWGMEPLSWALAQRAASLSAVDQLNAVRYLHRIGRDHAGALGDFDLMLTPVAATPPHALGQVPTGHGDVEGFLHRLFELYPFTVGANITGWPAISLPLAASRDGLPIGVQLSGPQGSEARLLVLGAELEAQSA